MKTYTKKPVQVVAVHYDGSPEGRERVFDFVGQQMLINLDGGLVIKTLEGEMTVTEGDYIIRGVKGEFYPCRGDIFEETYHGVHEPEPGTKKVVKMYLCSNKDSNWELGEKIGLSDEAISDNFAHALGEVEFDVEVDMDTGKSKILRVDGFQVG